MRGLVLLLVAGCTTHAPCKPGTVLVSVHFDSIAAQADSLAVTLELDGVPATDMPNVTRTAGRTDTTIEIDFTQGYPTGRRLGVIIEAFAGGTKVGSGEHDEVLAAGCTSGFAVAVGELLIPDLEGDVGPFDLSAPDLTSFEDLAAADLTPLPDLAPLPDLTPVACASSAECSDPAFPICDGTAMQCRACNGSGDDAACASHGASLRCKIAGANMGQCAQCNINSDCPTATPICNLDGTCRKCAQHTECGSGVCDLRAVPSNGQCASASSVVYVDIAAALCAGGNGSAASPYCEITTAIANLAGKTFIHVAPGAASYQGVGLGVSDLTVYLVGAPLSASQPRLAPTGPNNHALDVVAASNKTVNVTFDGFWFDGMAGASNVFCDSASSGASTVTLRNSTMTDGDRGFRAVKCNITVSESIISLPGIEGFTVDPTATWDVHNSFVFGSAGAGATLNSIGTFRFNTFTLNGGASNLAGGVTCSVAVTLESSIISDNAHTPPTTGTQFGGSCVLSNVVTGTDSISSLGKLAGTPVFVSTTQPFDLHLDVTAGAALTANQACCIDKVPANGTPIDIDGQSRPRGANADVGADEAQ